MPERMRKISQAILRLNQAWKVIYMETLNKLSDDEVRILPDNGFRFQRETLEQRMARTGLPLSVGKVPELGEAKGREPW